MIKKVKKILRDLLNEQPKYISYDKGYATNLEPFAVQICQLFEPELEPMEKLAIELKDCMYQGEPKPDEGLTYTLNCDRCGMTFYSKEAFPVPQVCFKCSKLGEDRLLSQDKHHEFEPAFMKRRFENKGNNKWLFLGKPIREAQDAKTASIKDAEIDGWKIRLVALYHKIPEMQLELAKQKDAECQERVERIFREIEEHLGGDINALGGLPVCMNLMSDFWQSLKEGLK